jgi:hypothetical protein
MQLPRTVLGYMSDCVVVMHVFGLQIYFKVHIYLYSVSAYLMLLAGLGISVHILPLPVTSEVCDSMILQLISHILYNKNLVSMYSNKRRGSTSHNSGRNLSYFWLFLFFFSSSLLPHVGACSRFGA